MLITRRLFSDPKSDENNESDREVEEILDKRLVEGKEPWYLIKWKNVDHSNNTWEPIEHLKCGEALIEAFEEKIQNQGLYFAQSEPKLTKVNKFRPR